MADAAVVKHARPLMLLADHPRLSGPLHGSRVPPRAQAILQIWDQLEVPAACRVLPLHWACDPLRSGAFAVSLPPCSAEGRKGNYMMGHHRCTRDDLLSGMLMEPPSESSSCSLPSKGEQEERPRLEQISGAASVAKRPHGA